MKVRTLLVGSGIFAARVFDKLIQSDKFEVVGLITQPDKPVGRKQILTPPPAKEVIISKGIVMDIFQPEKLKTDVEIILDKTKPDLVIVADYGQFLPKVILNYPKYKCLNIHGSLLPDLRGAVPIPISILKGYKKTGVSIPIMTPGLDDGDIVASAEIIVDESDTTESLKFKLADLGSDLLMSKVDDWVSGRIQPIAQNHSLATFTYQDDISKEKAQLKLDMNIELVERMVRAFNPWPIVWGSFEKDGKYSRIKIIKARIVKENINLNIGFLKKNSKNLFLHLKDGCLEIIKLQVEGKNVMLGSEALFLDDWKIVA